MTKFRKRLFEIIEIGAAKDFVSKLFDYVISVIIFVNIIVTFLSTFSEFDDIKGILNTIELVTVILFTIEYIARVYTADFLYPKKSRGKATLAFLFSFYGIVDFLSFFPYYLPFFTPTGVAVFRLFRVIRIFRLFKINAQFDAFNVIVNVLKKKKNQLISSVVLIMMLMLSASMLMYGVEHEAQPEVFKNALSGFWWSMATVFTIGYGDIYPVTFMGKVLALIISFLGVGIVAIPTGIISAGFVEQFSKIDKYKGHASGHEIEYMMGTVNETHSWVGKKVKDVILPPGSKIVMIKRDEEVADFNEDFVIKANDRYVLAAKNHKSEDENVSEIVISDEDKWLGKKVFELDLSANEQILTIKRNGKLVNLSGEVVIKKGDKMLIFTSSD